MKKSFALFIYGFTSATILTVCASACIIPNTAEHYLSSEKEGTTSEGTSTNESLGETDLGNLTPHILNI